MHLIATIIGTRLWHDESAKRLNRIEHVAVEVLNPWCESSHVLHHRLGWAVCATVHALHGHVWERDGERALWGPIHLSCA